MESDFSSTAVSLIGAAVSLFGALLTSLRAIQARRAQEKANVEAMLAKAIELAMEYPYLEQDSYCSAWPTPPRADEDRERYDNYCCFIFNLIERAWVFEKRRAGPAEALAPIREYAWRHRRWWNAEDANADGYDPKFVAYIDDLIVVEVKKRGIS